MYYICYRLFQLNLPILIWTDSRILRLWLNVTLMHFSNYNFSQLFEALGGSHQLEGPTLRIASAYNSLRCIRLRFPLSGKHWDKELLDDCYIGFNPATSCWHCPELWLPIRIGMPLQGISVLHYKVFLLVSLCYCMLLWITYENNKNSFKWSVPNWLSGNLCNTFVDTAILAGDGYP